MLYLLAAFVFALLTALANWKSIRLLLFIAKPAVLILLFIYLWTSTGLEGAVFWFGVGMLLSLTGDVLLLWIDRFFIFGLVSFLLAHVAYLVGLNMPTSPISFWGFMLAIIIGLGGARILRQIVSSLALTGQARMRWPVFIYGIVITLMLLASMLKLTDPLWDSGASGLVALGAFLFFLSDIVLAWNKFVTTIRNGRLINIFLYHCGQILIAAGVVMQFS